MSIIINSESFCNGRIKELVHDMIIIAELEVVAD